MSDILYKLLESSFVEDGGIEIENMSFSENNIDFSDVVSITQPFNPRDIKIDLKQMTLDLLIKRIRNQEIDLDTGFQRKKDLWDRTKQSRLIESLLINIPLPVFYFDASKDSKWLIVDGLQRISTFKNFIIDKSLKLKDLEYLDNYNDCTFDNLPRELQRRIEETQIVTYQIAEGTPDDVKFNLFKRINTGGLILEPQEIRHALNQGVPADFIKKLAESESFKNITIKTDGTSSIDISRMNDRDLVNRFIAFYLYSYQEFNSDLDFLMNKAMRELKIKKQAELDVIESNFYKALDAICKIFGDYAFRRQTKNHTKGPINKALFEVKTVSFAKLDIGEIELLIKRKDSIRNKYFDLLQDINFVDSITSGTSNVKNVKARFELFNNFLLDFLENKYDK